MSKKMSHPPIIKISMEEAALYFFLTFFSLIVIFPYLWMVLTSFKPAAEIFTPQMKLFPQQWQFSNYNEVLRTGSFLRYIINSIIVTSLGVMLEITLSFFGAYAFAKLDFYIKDFAFYLILGTLMIPPQVLMLPAYLTVNQIGWLDSYAGLIIPRAGAAFGIFLMRQFILSIPNDLDDAAKVDGAGILQRIFRIYLPLSLPSLVTTAVFSMIGFWNDYYWPLVITSSNEMRTLALGIGHFKSLEGMGQWELLMAAATIATVPMIIAFFVTRKTLIENLTAGAVKG